MRQSGRSWRQRWGDCPMRNEISDAALENYYRMGFMYSHGYDPLEGPYETEDDLDVLDDEEWEEE